VLVYRKYVEVIQLSCLSEKIPFCIVDKDYNDIMSLVSVAETNTQLDQHEEGR